MPGAERAQRVDEPRLGLRLRAGLAAGAAVAAALGRGRAARGLAAAAHDPGHAAGVGPRLAQRRTGGGARLDERQQPEQDHRAARADRDHDAADDRHPGVRGVGGVRVVADLLGVVQRVAQLAAAHRRLRRVDDAGRTASPRCRAAARPSARSAGRRRTSAASSRTTPCRSSADQPAGRDRRGRDQDDQRGLAHEHDQHVEERGRDDDQQRRARRGRWPG